MATTAPPGPPADATAGKGAPAGSYPKALQPLIQIGVTGHRKLADPAAATTAAAGALARVLAIAESAAWPVGMLRSSPLSATRLGFRVISPLAEGADRIVAGLAVTDDPALSGRTRELVVPLPFPVGFYRGSDGQPGSDCHDAGSQAEFDQLQTRALWTHELTSHAPTTDEQRKAGYAAVGKHVAGHCDVLFAFWDGEDTGEEGGTSHVVRYALDHSTPVVWFPVARSGDPEPPAAVASGGAPVLLTGPAEPNAPLARAAGAAVDFASPAARALLAGHRGRRSAAPKLPAERLARLEELCRYAGGDRHIPGAITGEMPVQREGGGSVRAVVTSVAQWIVPAYVIADGLAKRYQNWLKALNIGVYAGAAAAVSFGAAAAILLPFIHWQWLAVAEVATLLALLAVQWQDLRTKCRDRWVTYRALGEYFRIGRYLALVVPKEAHGFEYGRFARLYSWSSEPATTPWFAPVIGQVWDYRPPLDLRGTGVTWLRDYLISDWIAGQISYHEDRRDLHRRWDRRFTWIIRATLAVTLAAAIGHMLFDLVPGFAWLHGDAREVISRLLAFLAIALTSVAGAFNGYSGQQRHNYHCAHFGRMAKELRGIEESLEQAGTMTAILGHIGEVRRVTLGETTNWYEGMQAQEMDMPT